MKFCPACNTTYTEETLKFCTKDGTLLLTAAPMPNSVPFVPADEADEETDFLKPAPSADDEITVVHPNDKTSVLTPPPPNFTASPTNSRIVVSLAEPQAEKPNFAPVNQNNVPPNTSYQPPRKTNVAAAILLTFLGTLLLFGAVAGGVGGWWWWQSRNGQNLTAAANTNNNQNSNLGNDSNLGNANLTNSENPFANANYNANANANLSVNANRTPTPKPPPSPTPKPTPTLTPTPNFSNTDSANSPANTETMNRNRLAANNSINSRLPNSNTQNAPTPPKPPIIVGRNTPAPTPSGIVTGGVVNGRARNLVKPAYPPAAKAVNASGQVNVQVLIDEQGNVVSASAVSGHPLLRNAAENAARQSRFTPTILSGQPVKVSGTIVYNFVNNQ